MPTRLPATLAAIAILAGFAAGPVDALEVVSTSPARYALHVPSSLSTISITLNAAPVPPAAGAVRVFGTMSGLHHGTVSVVGNTISFAVQGAWLPGELVNVNLRRDIATVAGDSLAGGRYFAFTIRSAASSGSWSAPVAYQASDVPYFIYGGDLNGDGRPDIASPNEGTDNFSVWLNQGGGSFGTRQDYGVGDVPSSCFGDDFDNDGDTDIATADIASGTVSVSLNVGDGTFLPSTPYPANTTTRQVQGGDFDGDNDIDLCATSYGADQVFVYENLGDGTFTAHAPITNVAAGPFAIRAADFDNDGHLDIAVACQDADSVTVLRNQGGGVFAATGRYATGNGPWCLNGNDMDGDGDFELVTVTSFNNRVQVLFNDGTGAFPTKTGALTGNFPLGVFVADLDGDGDEDVTSSNYGAGTVGVYRNPGNGAIALATTLDVSRSGSYTWAHDLDADGDLDLSVVDELADTLFVFFNLAPSGSPEVSAPRPRSTAAILARPNPVPPGASTTLELTGFEGRVALDVFGVDGRRVRRLFAGDAARNAVFVWDGRDDSGRKLPAGTFFVRAAGEHASAARPVRLLR
jgi:hypothetical protein